MTRVSSPWQVAWNSSTSLANRSRSSWLKMAFEIINVHLSRSNPSIPWGFSLCPTRNGDISVCQLAPQSMAEKSGIQMGDLLQQFFDTPINATNLPSITARIQTANDLSMALKRFLKNAPSLPWSIREGPNKDIVVDHWNESGRVIGQSDKSTPGYVASFKADGPIKAGGGANFEQQKDFSAQQIKNFSLPIQKTASQSNSSQLSRTFGPTMQKLVQPNNPIHNQQQQPASYYRQMANGREEPSARMPTTQQHHQHTILTSGMGRAPPRQLSQQQAPRTQFPISSQPQQKSAQRTPQAAQYQNSIPPQPQSRQFFQSGHPDYSQPLDVDTSQWYGHSQFDDSTIQSPQKGPASGGSQRQARISTLSSSSGPPYCCRRTQSAAPYAGSRVYYTRYSPRTYRELSPQATVIHMVPHLQHNPPLNLYPPQLAADAYCQQTGKEMPHIEGAVQRPAYWDSETRKMVMEEDAGGPHPNHPPPQSNSFKRIAQAVGTPL